MIFLRQGVEIDLDAQIGEIPGEALPFVRENSLRLISVASDSKMGLFSARSLDSAHDAPPIYLNLKFEAPLLCCHSGDRRHLGGGQI